MDERVARISEMSDWRPIPPEKVHMAASEATTHRQAEFNWAASLTAVAAFSNRRMYMADAAAAAMLHKSPTLKPIDCPSVASRAVPPKAANADTHVGIDICRPNKNFEKNGTNLTLRYSRNPDLCAVVVSSPNA